MNKFLSKLAVIVLAAVSTLSANAQFFDHLGANVQVGTNGISVEAATNITRFVNLRVGADFIPSLTFTSGVDYYAENQYGSHTGSVDLKGDFGRVQGHFIFNVYPAPKVPFYVAVGGYFAGNKLVKISGHSDELATLNDNGYAVIGDMEIPADKNGNIKGGLKVNGFRPYVGIGWGRSIPNKLLNFGIDLGVQFEGRPKVYTDYGQLNTSLYEDDNTFNKIADGLRIYPVLALKLQFKAF